MKRPDFPLTLALLAIACATPETARAQAPFRTQAGEMMMFQSAGAARVVEKVRSETQGVMVEISVKPGDPVIKGQILGHLELDAVKLQLDLARHAMESKGSVEAARNQAEAWTVAREETAEAVRKRELNESRLQWATAMEKMYQSNYETQLETEKTQAIQYEYCQQQYDKHFLRAPVDGIVSEVVVEPGKSVTFATHVFTISNDDDFIIPVSVPAALAEAAVTKSSVPVRSSDGKSVSHARVDGVTDDPRTTGGKILRLLVHAADFPALVRAKLKGMKFDVLLPEVAANAE